MTVGRVRATLALALFATVASGFPSTDAAAQGIDGVVRLQASGGAAAGVLVAAYDDDGERVRAALTDATGGFTIDVPAGRYRIQAERIGLSTTTVEGVVVSGNERVFRRVEMADRAIELAGLVVDSRVRSCRTGSREASRVQRWWSEVRTALGVSAALQEEEFGTFLVERFERVWDEDLEEVVAAGRRWEVSTSTRPFVSAPADELLERGFVTGRFGLDREYYGPDADVLLSTIFLNAHCFTLDDDREDEGQLGLRFEPVEESRIIDIAGTFWVDTTTATLTELDFEYVNLEGPDGDGAGGGARFSYLSSGAWIVSEWYIRIPRTGVRGRRNRLQTIGYFDGGGSVTPLDTGAPVGAAGAVGAGPPSPGAATAGSVSGVVHDRVRGSTLDGAVVSVLGTNHTAVTDAGGRFSIPDVPVGLRYLSFEHPDLTAWGVDARPRSVEVSPGEAVDVDLATPTFEEAALDLCLEAGIDAITAITGTVVSPESLPVLGARIQLEYEVRAGPGGSLSRVNASTNEFGRFAVCTAPSGVDVTLSLRVDGEWQEITEMETAEGRIVSQRIRLVR